MAKTPSETPDEGAEARQQWRLWSSLNQRSRRLIYTTLMRGGGEPFGTPFELGLSSLTTKLVKYYRQKGFWHFTTVERLKLPRLRNKFTRHGAATYHGKLTPTQAAPKPPKRRWRFL